MPQGNNWQECLNNCEYKDQLIEMIKQYVMESSVPELLQEKNNILFRLPEIKLLHGSKVDSDVIVVCKDTDVPILMVWTYIKLNITNDWYLKYEHEKFANIRKIYSYLGKTLSLSLQKIQALAGYNITSYFY